MQASSTNSSWKTLAVIFAAAVSLSIVGFWIFSLRNSDRVVSLLGAGYALLCTAFLVAQISAFVKSHLDYDKTIEKPKYDVIKLEEDEWGS